MIRPHDLIWINERAALGADEALPEWVSQQWRTSLPLVVRRDVQEGGRIPVGIRGMKRSQRAAAWVSEEAIRRIVTPESLVSEPVALLHSTFVSQQPVQALIMLAQRPWPWTWGVTGSCGYALATEIPVMHADSDLDLVVRCPQPASLDDLQRLAMWLQALPCRADAQLETPLGGFALSEWLRDGRAMLKTAAGPRLTRDPWASFQED
ncbi:MAG: malonate decarboxylase holo-ACP synthase [Enterobacterales bacterium]|uniref:malonate decarboxylase holo-ACP synthase n=1 Tax=Serratia sp. (in: enterobacteria) TaxID=616 RepID=UPI003F33E291